MYSSRAMIVCALTITALGAMLISGAALGARADMELDSLRGLGSVYLIVQAPSAELAHEGLSGDQIKQAVTKQLKTAGIDVLASSSDLKDEDAIFLIALTSVKGETGHYACSIDAQLIQITSLARDPKMMVPATTWTSGMVAMVDGTGMGYLQDRVTKLVDEFVTDYKSVNLPISGETRSA